MANSIHNLTTGSTATLTATRATSEPFLVGNFRLMNDSIEIHALDVGFTTIQDSYTPENWCLSLDQGDLRTMMRNRPMNPNKF